MGPAGRHPFQWALLVLALALGLWILLGTNEAGDGWPGAPAPALAQGGSPTPTWPIGSPVTGLQMRVAYGVTRIPYQGQGKLVVILDATIPTTLATDASNFATANSLPAPQLTVIPQAPVSGTVCPPPTSDHETNLDVQMVMAFAPQAKIAVLCTGGLSYQDFVNAITYANTLNPHVVSMSLHVTGLVNPTGPPPWAPNVVYVGSSGDGGYNNDPTRSFMSNPWPREDPNVLAVGGTALYLATPGPGTPSPAGLPTSFPLYFTERAWSCPPSMGGCSGGGLATATLYPLPAYQATVVPPALATAIASLPPGARGRLVPDVALLAASDTGPLIYVNGSMSPIASGGTSAAAPLWAGLLALAVPTTGVSTQQVATALYTLGASPTAYAANFNDILYGTNGNCQNPPAPPIVCQAGPGYDLVTGLGSPKANALVPTLAAMLGAPLLPTATNTRSVTPTDSPATATVRALTATPTDLPATATSRALTATPTDLPATATVRALTATPTDLPATATSRALTATPTDLPATATVRALTATPTDLPATATSRALTRTATPTLSLPALPPSGTPGAPCTTVVGGTCTVSGGVTGTWIKTSSGLFTVTGTAPAGALAGIPAIQIPTTANRGGEPFFTACSAITGPGSTTTCTGTTTGDILQGATIVITYPNAFVGGVTSTGTATGANTANTLTPAQAQTQVLGTAGFLTGTGGAPCAVAVGQSCSVAGALSGSLLRTGSMRFTLTGTVPAGLIAGLTPVAVFSTDGGFQAVACAAPTAGAGGTTVTCTGTIAGNALQGSTVALCFTATTPCLLGTISGQTLAPPPLLLPVPFLPPPPPPPPPVALLPPPLLPPVGPPALGPAPAAGVPVIPEADSVVLLLAGLTALGIAGRCRLLRRG